MNRIELAFSKSHLKRAIYELEVANKQKPECVDVYIIIELKNILEKLENEESE